MIKKTGMAGIVLLAALTMSGCAQMMADSLYHDRYAQPATVTRIIQAASRKSVMNAAVIAAAQTGWTPKTISIDTGYLLAEAVPPVQSERSGRDYTYRLALRVPDNGHGEAQVVVTPPHGMISSKSSEQLANDYLDALVTALLAKPR